MNTNTEIPIAKMVCSICKMNGHNKKTCPTTPGISNLKVSLSSASEDNVSIPLSTNPEAVPPVLKKRRNVDYNICELVDAILLAFYGKILPPDTPAPTNIENIRAVCQGWLDTQTVPSCIRLNDFIDLSRYMTDLTSKTACISQRMFAFKKFVIENANNTAFKVTDMLCIYVSGKKNAHEKIRVLNSGLDIKQQKGDIYIEYTNGEIVGWSCKQSSHATKSNYSVQKILGATISKNLNKIKSDFLTTNGFPRFSKEQRDNVNQLFYPKNKENPYWNAMREEISNNKTVIINELVKGLTGITIPYTLYEFDGTSFHCLNTTTTHNGGNYASSTTFEEHAEYYKMKNGAERSAAKLFYQLCVSDKKYRVEIRWKGNVHAASPQFQIHDDDDDHSAIIDDEEDSQNSIISHDSMLV
jgi:hypothetical protein